MHIVVIRKVHVWDGKVSSIVVCIYFVISLLLKGGGCLLSASWMKLHFKGNDYLRVEPDCGNTVFFLSLFYIQEGKNVLVLFLVY